ncbi:type III pantothenate kinase [Methylophilus sp. YYY-1]|uniref:type III pantothenate kinase n=1 Tax=Methylophilus sp. YYY-1 TaxID=2682087 RepID=UPI0023B31CD3|nr:type III pantothenate kinase [Methylophilus sp. YYY-1]MDF0378520.1 type III pantothenate kinase [Methylophilus sp. YYY-1]
MKLLIDAGNSRTKWAWCPEQSSQSTALQINALDNQDWFEGAAQAQALHAAIAKASLIYLSNVAGERWLQALHERDQRLQAIVATSSALGLQNSYSQPSQLGSDRWCSLLAVWRSEGKSALVVSAGTAMTMDALVIKKAQAMFAGGSIQPGLRLMWQSLQQGAAQLDYAYPDLDAGTDSFAQNSQHAMWLGCVQALAASVAAQYARLCQQLDHVPLLFMSGGDADLIARYLPHALSAQAIIVDNLVLKGLACLAECSDE